MRKKQRAQTPPLVKPATLVAAAGTAMFLGLAVIMFILKWHAAAGACTSADGSACPADIEAAITAGVPGKPLLFFSYRDFINQLQPLSQPYIVKTIEKTLGGRVTATLLLETPAYFVTVPQQEYVVTLQGHVFEKTDTQSGLIPVVLHTGLPQGSASMPPQQHAAILSMLDAASRYNIPLAQIEWVDNLTIRLSMKERPVKAVIDSLSPQKQLAALALLLESPEVAGLSEPVSEIDVRFTMPVLRTQP